MKEIFIILACVPLYATNAFCDKYASMKNGTRMNAFYNALKFFIGSFFFIPLVILDDAPKFGWGAIICGIVCGIMYAISKTLIMTGYEKTSVAFMSLCHASGMIVPCVLGHFLWGEKLSLVSVIGIALAILSIVLLKDSKGKAKKYELLGIIIGIIIFLTSGTVMVMQKMMSLYFKDQSVSAYNYYSFVAAFFILIVISKPHTELKARTKSVYPFAIGSALSLCIVSMVMTLLAGKVPSVVLFPLFNGLGIILVCFGSIFLFKEKMTAKKLIGIIIGVLGLCLVNF
ncbi:MAG: EamA family transporter [Clostridia bacterium]|nr:EamA family transporter [Clostridia bacterium]